MRFSLLGIPVSVRPAFWLVGVLLGAPRDFSPDQLTRLGVWMVILFVSILVHELGHAFAMRAVGRTPRIELWGMGGLTHWGDGPRVSGWKRAGVSVAGPFAGFALAVPIVIAWVAAGPADGTLAHEAIWMGLWINVGWGALNLLPILPLDGGHVMEVALAGTLGARGPRIARYVSIALAVGVAVLALQYDGMQFAALLAFFFAFQNVRQLGAPATDGAIPARAEIDPELARALDEAWSA
ncbi:MAG: site-2 protease family protein, partial [Myxococcota bacterium]|nr:site-2 protease family protein [Myxococcota bacterium]